MCVICRDTNANANDHCSTVNFVDLCEITADVTKLKKSIQPQINPGAGKYCLLDFDVVLLLGLTELKAQIAWTRNVSERFSPEYADAKVITGSRDTVR